ncbi:hypothetical protein LINPERHAP1_LOCUS22096, partial [Linum perenne]
DISVSKSLSLFSRHRFDRSNPSSYCHVPPEIITPFNFQFECAPPSPNTTPETLQFLRFFPNPFPMNFFDTIMLLFTNPIWIHICRFVAINIAFLFFNLHMFFHQSRFIDYRVSE